MRVADRRQLVRAAAGVALVQRGEDRAGRRPGGAVAGVPGVAEVVEAGEQLARERRVERRPRARARAATARSKHSRQASGSKRASSQASRTNGERVRYGPLRALARRRRSRTGRCRRSRARTRTASPPRRRAISVASGRGWRPGAVEALHGPAVDATASPRCGCRARGRRARRPRLRAPSRRPAASRSRTAARARRRARPARSRGSRPPRRLDAADRARDLQRVDRRALGMDERGEARLGVGAGGRACTGGAGARAAGDPTRSCGRQRVGAGRAAPGQSAGGAARTIESCGASARARYEKHHGRR